MPDIPTLFTVEIMAEQFNMHPEAIRRAIRRRHLGCYRLNGCIRASADQRATHLKASLCPACEQIVPAAARGGHEQTSAIAEFQRGRRLRRAPEPRRSVF